MNLFSAFDPSTGTISLNWLSILLLLMIVPNSYWNLPNKKLMFMLLMMMKSMKETSVHTNKTEPSIFFVSMFMFILFNNMMGLLPYIFTSSAHLVFSLPLALTTWMSLMAFCWINKTNKMFTHLVPIGTPYPLMPLMVIIESISNLIRPGSLAVRLSANMIQLYVFMTLSTLYSSEI